MNMKMFFKLKERNFMLRSEEYNTKQKDIIFGTIINKNREFTVKDIYEELGKKIGLTTIYRFVDKLVSDDKLVKFIGKDNITYYQYLEECCKDNHFYLKCDRCGCMIHIDCDCIMDLSHHIVKEHHFKLNQEHIIIHGVCQNCL